MGILKKDGKGKRQKYRVTFKLDQDKEMGDVCARENDDMVPDRERKEAGEAEVKKVAADRAEKLWACINKTTVSASALTFLAKRSTRADVWRIPVSSASPCFDQLSNTTRISYKAPPSPTRSAPGWNAGTRLPPIANVNENAKMLFQQRAREQAPLVLIDLEDETDTQERTTEVMEVQTASRKDIMKRTASDDASRIKKGLVSAAGLAVSSLPLEPVSRGAARATSPQDKVKYKSSTRPDTSRMYDFVSRDLQEIPHSNNRPHNPWQLKCDKRKETKRDASVQTLVTALKDELEGVEESGKRKEAEQETEQRGGEEKKDSEVHGKEPGKKWWRRLMCLLPCFCAKFGQKQK